MKRAWMVLALCLPCPAFAGAWLQESGAMLLSTQAFLYGTDSYYNTSGNLTSQQKFSKTELNAYAEYGWSDHVTLGTNLFLNRVEQGSNDNVGLADSEFFARVLLWKSNQSVLSIQPLIKLPSLYQRGGAPRGGTSSTDAELSLLFGHGFKLLSSNDYIDTRFGYRERSGDLNGQWRADISYGVQLSDKWQLVQSVRAIQAAQMKPAAFTNSGELDYDLGKAEWNAYYTLDETRTLQFGYFAHVMGKQTGAGQGIAFGLTQRF